MINSPFWKTWSMTDIVRNFDIPIDTWLRWSNQSVTLNPIYCEKWRDDLDKLGHPQPDTDKLNLVANVRAAILTRLDRDHSITLPPLNYADSTIRAFAELVIEQLAFEAEDEAGNFKLAITVRGLDVAATLPKQK